MTYLPSEVVYTNCTHRLARRGGSNKVGASFIVLDILPVVLSLER